MNFWLCQDLGFLKRIQQHTRSNQSFRIGHITPIKVNRKAITILLLGSMYDGCYGVKFVENDVNVGKAGKI